MTLLPRSLFGRNVLLIVGIIALGQLTTALVFLQAVQKPRVDELVAITAAQVHALGVTLNLLPPDVRDRYIEQFNKVGILQFDTTATRAPESTLPTNLHIHYFVQALAKKIGNPTDVIWQSGANEAIWIRVPVGQTSHWLRLSGQYIRPPFSGWWLLASFLCGGLAFLGAFLIQRKINRPLLDLTTAAEAMGRGEFPDSLPEDTAAEIAKVSRSFNAMVDSLRRLDSERTLMLAGISHDLRTPLTKLRLGLEIRDGNGSDDLSRTMIRQIEEMDTVIEQFVDFARLGSDENLVHIDLNLLIKKVAESFEEQGSSFRLNLAPIPLMTLRPVALQRLLGNLMQNAVRYANVGLEVETKLCGTEMELRVLDRGPGIPTDQLERLKQPFTRLNQARAGMPGAGLGLAIVEKITRLHGGEFILKPRNGGGLVAIVTLPLIPEY
jgi:two-component system osmolarity sensor histidine kinase EnvZ